MAPRRGNLDTIGQTQLRELSGGTFATKIVTTDESAKTTGNVVTFDARGNLVDSGFQAGEAGIGSSITHSEMLTDGNSNLLFANGDVIAVVGVPN